MTVDEMSGRLGSARAFASKTGNHSPVPGSTSNRKCHRIRRPGSPEEIRAIRDMVARLRSTWLTVAEVTIRSAYDSFRQAGVSACVPVLMERQARRVLGAVADGLSPGQHRGDGERK